MKRWLPILICMIIICASLSLSVSAQEAAVTEIEVGIPVEENPELFVTHSMPTHGEGKIAVFLIDFPDYRNENPYATAEYYDRAYFHDDGAGIDWDDLSVAEFYRQQSYGKLNLSGRVFDWYTAEHERAYYEGREDLLVMEAMTYYDGLGTDFTEFDGDGDGVLDAVAFHFAGSYSNTQGEPWYQGLNRIAGGGWDFGEIDGVKLIGFIQLANRADLRQWTTVNVASHELMHSFGIFDLYSNSKGGFAPTFDLMTYNNNTINPYIKILLGWMDTVKVVTGDAEDVLLTPYGTDPAGTAVIVTDSFNGIYDEFYLVAYRDFGFTNAVIWHIDARLNEEGTAFRYHNLSYDPRPDKHGAHDVENPSEYLFIEEICSPAELNQVMNDGLQFEEIAFGPNSVLGADTFPSSDTHDGRFTGIRIDGFTEDVNETSLTFDVTFVEDTAVPRLKTKEEDLALSEKVTLRFHEAIYEGKAFGDIQITSPNGNPLTATVLRPHYPTNEIEIVFGDEAYQNGYCIVFPEGAICDSSGNAMPETVLTVSRDRFLFPTGTTELPSADGESRDNLEAFFFHEEDGLLVITKLWHDHLPGARLEFMRLNEKGEVTEQIIIDNPIEDTEIAYAFQIDADTYVFLCRGLDDGDSPTFFGTDGQGNLKWINTDYRDEASYFEIENHLVLNGELILRRSMIESGEARLYRINGESGEISWLTDSVSKLLVNTDYSNLHPFYDLGGGRMLYVYRQFFSDNEMTYQLRVVDCETLTILAEGKVTVPVSQVLRRLENVYVNSDGTMLVHFISSQYESIVLLDAALNTIDSKSWYDVDGLFGYVIFIPDEGFCRADVREKLSHENIVYRYYRYDRNFNLLWMSDLSANFVYYYKTSNDGLMIYRSAFEPVRACYIEFCESEASRRVEHLHTMEHREAAEATCQNVGYPTHWYCTSCGGCFVDEGGTESINIQGQLSPLREHTPMTVPAVPATCQAEGMDSYEKCDVCGEILSPFMPNKIPMVNHSSVWKTVQEASCVSDGLRCYICTVCGDELDRDVIPASEKYHQSGKWTEGKRETCQEAGFLILTCAVCGVEMDRKVTPASDKYHAPGDWVVIREATAESDGLEAVLCLHCGEQMRSRAINRLINITPPITEAPDASGELNSNNASYWGGVLTMCAGGVIVLGIVITIILIRKKRH